MKRAPIKSALIAALAAALLIASLAPAALAQQEGESPRERVSERLQERWEKVRQRLELIITRFENNKERHVKVYNEMKAKVRQLLEQMQEKGLDVSKLSQDLAAWDEMIKRFASDYAALMETLKQMCELEGDKVEEDFRRMIQEAREQLRKVHQDVMEIRLFYQKTIRSDIQDLRSQLEGSGQGT
jgi:septation ring formation regulator EzrA